MNLSVLRWLKCNHLSVPGSFASKSLSWECLQARLCSRGALQAEVAGSGSSRAKSVCPRGALQAEVPVPRGLLAKSVCSVRRPNYMCKVVIYVLKWLKSAINNLKVIW